MADMNYVQRFVETSTLLAGGATRNGAQHDTGPADGAWASKFRALVDVDQAGTLAIEQSEDGNAWHRTISQAVAAGATVVESMCVLKYARAVFINGAAAQGAFTFRTALVAV